jgi:hypothetical protein
MMGTGVANPTLASGHNDRDQRPDIWTQAIKIALHQPLQAGRRPHMDSRVYAFATLRLRPRMTKAWEAQPTFSVDDWPQRRPSPLRHAWAEPSAARAETRASMPERSRQVPNDRLATCLPRRIMRSNPFRK